MLGKSDWKKESKKIVRIVLALLFPWVTNFFILLTFSRIFSEEMLVLLAEFKLILEYIHVFCN